MSNPHEISVQDAQAMLDAFKNNTSFANQPRGIYFKTLNPKHKKKMLSPLFLSQFKLYYKNGILQTSAFKSLPRTSM